MAADALMLMILEGARSALPANVPEASIVLEVECATAAEPVSADRLAIVFATASVRAAAPSRDMEQNKRSPPNSLSAALAPRTGFTGIIKMTDVAMSATPESVADTGIMRTMEGVIAA